MPEYFRLPEYGLSQGQRVMECIAHHPRLSHLESLRGLRRKIAILPSVSPAIDLASFTWTKIRLVGFHRFELVLGTGSLLPWAICINYPTRNFATLGPSRMLRTWDQLLRFHARAVPVGLVISASLCVSPRSSDYIIPIERRTTFAIRATIRSGV